VIEENMAWPIKNLLTFKMMEHSAWYSGSTEVLANFYHSTLASIYTGLQYNLDYRDSFWGRQIANKAEIMVHVPIAGDIAEVSANLLFSEPPIIKISEAYGESATQGYKNAQEEMANMLTDSGFYRKILEASETCAAMGGAFIKLAWDRELSEYPIPVIMQIDNAIPVFKFGILQSVIFWREIGKSDNGNKVYRLLEEYVAGAINYTLYSGSEDRLGIQIDLAQMPEFTYGLQDTITTGVDELLAIYVPNVLPNRLVRSSCMGRSDFSGVEGLMDRLDEVFSSWMKDIALSQAKIHIPDQYLQKGSDGVSRYNLDQMLYQKLDMDPTIEGDKITPIQFAIRSEDFERTAINLVDRIVTSAGYSPQSFGLNISGRAESGTALNIRERKSFATKAKKQIYWQSGLIDLVRKMILLYNAQLSPKIRIDENVTINVSFSDSVMNDSAELSGTVKMLAEAQSASISTRIRMLHPEWSDDQVAQEKLEIQEESGTLPVVDPDMV